MAKTRSTTYFGEAHDDARQCLIVLKDIPGLAAAGVSAYFENPFAVDAVVAEVVVEITTLEAGDEDIDIGLADDAAGTNVGTEILDSIVNTGAYLKTLTGIIAAIGHDTSDATGAAGAAHAVLKARGNATDSFFCAYQNGTNGASTLVYSLYVTLVAKD